MKKPHGHSGGAQRPSAAPGARSTEPRVSKSGVARPNRKGPPVAMAPRAEAPATPRRSAPHTASSAGVSPPRASSPGPASPDGASPAAPARFPTSTRAPGSGPRVGNARKRPDSPGGRAPASRPTTPEVIAAGMSPRALAISIMARVAATDAYLNVVLDSVLDEHRLREARNSAFVTELCYGATRRQLALDYALLKFLDRPLSQLEDKVLAALRLGAYQLFFMRVPSHAAVADTIEGLKQVGLGRASGFVNAILRKLSTLTAPPLPDEADRDEWLSVKHSHPLWLVKKWLRQFGPERAEAMLAADNVAPELVVRVNTSRTTRDELLAEFAGVGLEARPTVFSSVGIVLPGSGRVEDLFGYAEGLWQVQDEAAQLVGLYGAIPANARVLDACAAPGGKACHLAESHQVLAVDLHGNKLHKILAEAGRLGLSEQLTVKQADASALSSSLGFFDAVLIDAPCTGLGTLRRHPELRYRRVEVDVARLAGVQRAILESCQARVAPGGLLVYAVCSIESQEGADQIEMFLRSHPEFTAEAPTQPFTPPLPTAQGYLRTLPGPEGMDGFFAARLRKLH